ncbi:acyl-CoA dehydrogenase family protein [Hyalangium gracile]|uniref:acyl-CoA dehydrogenase family protein n=1 Tax=Hyalangium gracile TaxID=394092 RepID=UPI001CCCFD0F|nr:acyl-CoA dehydrogenase family protein [Hyalangium gracile]
MSAMGDPLSAARGLRATIRAVRQETEQGRRLPPSVVQGLIDNGLCRMQVPASLGGLEVDPLVALQVYEELGAAEASVAWIAWNNALPALLSRHLPEAARAELFSDGRRLFANSTRPMGRAVVAEGGYRVSGRWSLVSGCELAEWIPVMSIIIEGSAPRMMAPGVPEMRMAYVPRGSYRIVDTWHVGGLRGTGSHDVVVEDVFVPAERTFSFFDPVRIDRPLFQMPWVSTVGAWCAGICLGIARTATDTLLELATSKSPVDPGPGLRDRPSVQAMVASSSASLEAARLLLIDALGDVWATCSRGAASTEMQRARLWGGTIHAVRTAKATVTSMYEAAGATALYNECLIERAHRDIHAVTQHIVLAQSWMEEAGRVRLGLKPNHPFF